MDYYFYRCEFATITMVTPCVTEYQMNGWMDELASDLIISTSYVPGE